MKILKLQAENIKKLKAIEIIPEGNTVVISGKNAQGKSSILDSIYYALAGEKVLPDKPIRDGEDKAKIVLDLGDLVVTRSFTAGNSYLKVETKDGAVFNKGQGKLTDLVGKLTFDPLEFSKKDAKEQRAIIMQLTGLDFSEDDAKRKELFDERTSVGSVGKQYAGELANIKIDEADLKLTEVNVSEINQQIVSLTTEFNQLKDLESERDNLCDSIEQKKQRIKELELEITGMDNKVATLTKDITKYSKTDYNSKIKELNAQINEASTINNKVANAKRYNETNAKAEKYRKEYQDLTEKIKLIDQTKSDKLAKAKMPIPGLSFDENGVLFNSIPFNQLSSAEQLKISMSVAMALNPTLRIIRILDGSLLDSENMRVISELAEQNDYQVWIEVVKDEKGIGFYIEDGEIVE